MRVFAFLLIASAALLLNIVDARADIAGVTAISDSNAVAKSGSASIAAPEQSVNISSPGDITYRGGYAVYAPPAIAAPALTTTLTDTCMGSWSAGLSIPGGGATFGKTQIDDDCVARLHARQLVAMNANPLAMEVLCSRKVIQEADLRMPKGSQVCRVNLDATPPSASTEPPKVAIRDSYKQPVTSR